MYAGDGGRVTSGRTYKESKEATESEDGREGEKRRAEEKTRFVVEEPVRSTSKERKHGQTGTVPKHQACVQNSKPGVQKTAQENMNQDHLVEQERARAHRRTRKRKLADGGAKIPTGPTREEADRSSGDSVSRSTTYVK